MYFLIEKLKDTAFLKIQKCTKSLIAKKLLYQEIFFIMQMQYSNTLMIINIFLNILNLIIKYLSSYYLRHKILNYPKKNCDIIEYKNNKIRKLLKI